MQTNMQQRLLSSLIDLAREERAAWLDMRTPRERDAIYAAWGGICSAEDVAYLPEPHRAFLVRYVCGDPASGIPDPGRVFTIVATGEPTLIEIGSRHNQRQYARIGATPLPMPAARAISALLQAGAEAEVDTLRGRVREYIAPALAAEEPTTATTEEKRKR